MGRLDEALAELDAVFAAREEGWKEYVGAASAFRALCQIDRGALADARAALAVMEQPGMKESFEYLFLLEARGRLALAESDPEQAAQVFLGAGPLQEEVFSVKTPAFCAWRSGAALALHALGDDRQALELVDEELEISRRIGGGRLIARALTVRGLVAGGEEGLSSLDEAVETLAGGPPRLEHVRALVEQGAARRRAGKRRLAREPLQSALELATRGGATALAQRARDELAALGVRARTAARLGRDALTPSELRVARMAAEGLSNRQIAQALFVTPKAVEWHLSSTYRKLDISSRRDLPPALDAESAPT
jgi:DNA-binding CsgD family transcriptional regulator